LRSIKDYLRQKPPFDKLVEEALGLVEKGTRTPRCHQEEIPKPFGLDVDPLKDIASQYALDHGGSVMRLKRRKSWSTTIMTMVRSRGQHGDPFRNGKARNFIEDDAGRG